MKRSMVIALSAAALVGLGYARAQDQSKPATKPADTKKATPPASKPAAKGAAPAAAPAAAAPAAVNDPQLKDLPSQAAYGFGINFGLRLKPQCSEYELDPKLVARGIVDGLTGAKSAMTDEQIQAVMQEFEKQINAKQLALLKAAAEKAKTEGAAFLAANKQKPGVKSTASGLQYRVLKEGTGAVPKATDTVEINYKGSLIDGSVFDSTDQNGPMTNPVAGFIDGWKEALTLMKVGDKFEVVIPSELGYGVDGTPGGPIPPNAVLVFEIELLGIK